MLEILGNDQAQERVIGSNVGNGTKEARQSEVRVYL